MFSVLELPMFVQLFISAYLTRAPDINVRGVISRAEYKLWSTVIPRANVRYVGFAPDQMLSAAKVTEFQNP